MSSRAFQFLCEENWAINEEHLRLGAQMVFREHIPDFEAVAAKRAKMLDGTRAAKLREGGIAVIEIIGPITRHASYFSDWCGGATVETLAQDFNAALNDPSINAIVFKVDSPGGSVTGINEFAQMIFEARGKKPVVAYGDGLVASAAYWITSACEELVMDNTAIAGSIGVISRVSNPDAERSRDITFVSSQSPNKNAKPNTTHGAAQIQQLIDDLADVFISTVARNREVSIETVLSDFGQGGVMVGQRAIDAGLADRLGSFEQLISELSVGTWKRKQKPMKATSAAIEEGETGMTDETFLAKLKAAFGFGEPKASLEPSTVAAEPEADDEAARWKADAMKLRAERRERIEADASAYATQLLKTAKALPFQAAQIAEDYVLAATDDLDSPLAEGSRLAKLKARHEAMSAHSLLTETVPSERVTALLPDKADDQAAATEKRRTELLALTPLGSAALRLVK